MSESAIPAAEQTAVATPDAIRVENISKSFGVVSGARGRLAPRPAG